MISIISENVIMVIFTKISRNIWRYHENIVNVVGCIVEVYCDNIKKSLNTFMIPTRYHNKLMYHRYFMVLL